MIIVGQDKDIILNFNNTESIAILNPLEDNDGMFRVGAITPSDNEYTLGKYAIEERAKEVLQEIINAIECWEDFKAGMPYDTPNFKYEMPKE